MHPTDLSGLRKLYEWARNHGGACPDIELASFLGFCDQHRRAFPVLGKIGDDVRRDMARSSPDIELGGIMHMAVETVAADLEGPFNDLEREILAQLTFRDMNTATLELLVGFHCKVDLDDLGEQVERALDSLRNAGHICSDGDQWALIPF